MRFETNTRGEWLVDPDELAGKLGISAPRLRLERYLKFLHVRIETGRGSDEGRSRITVRSRQTTWQGTFDRSGALVSEGAG